MGRKKKDSRDGLLTPFELQIMTALWRLGEGSVHDVLAALPKGDGYAYNTVSTILRLLQEKEVVEARKDGRGHIYIPTVAKAEYEGRALSHMVSSVFAGRPQSLVKRLLDENALSSSELDEIRKLLEESERS